eukprot:30294-Pelagococcus_subviridis.AAC.10
MSFPVRRVRSALISTRSFALEIVVCSTRIFFPFTGARSSILSFLTLKSAMSPHLKASQKLCSGATFVVSPSAIEPTCRQCSECDGEITAHRFSLNESSGSISDHSGFNASFGTDARPPVPARRFDPPGVESSPPAVGSNSSRNDRFKFPPSSSKPPYVYTIPLRNVIS